MGRKFIILALLNCKRAGKDNSERDETVIPRPARCIALLQFYSFNSALACLGPCREGTHERRRFRGALLLGAALVGVTGFLGNVLIYGWQTTRGFERRVAIAV